MTGSAAGSKATFSAFRMCSSDARSASGAIGRSRSAAPREDRRRDLARIGRREHEHDVRRRLLEGLQECIERGLGELMDLVDDVDLVLAARRRVLDVLAERPDLFDAPVRGAVDLDHVDERAGQSLDAHRALAARLGARTRGAEQRARQRLASGQLRAHQQQKR